MSALRNVTPSMSSLLKLPTAPQTHLVRAGLFYGQESALQKSCHLAVNLEAGHQVMKHPWTSVGFNVHSLSECDLTASEHTGKGAHFRLRFKFDETSVSFAKRAGTAAVRVGAVAVPAPTAGKASLTDAARKQTKEKQ